MLLKHLHGSVTVNSLLNGAVKLLALTTRLTTRQYLCSVVCILEKLKNCNCNKTHIPCGRESDDFMLSCELSRTVRLECKKKKLKQRSAAEAYDHVEVES